MKNLSFVKRFSFFAVSAVAQFISMNADASVRQRVFSHEKKGATTGSESIVHWEFSQAPKIEIHEWDSGSPTLGNSSTLTFSNVRAIFGTSLGKWVAGVGGAIPRISLDLDSGNPYSTTSGCEVTAGGLPDSHNNIVFTSKLNTSCASEIPSAYGIIGLTKIRYAADTGQIVEGDLQFDDTQFRFTSSGTNVLDTNTVNLHDVAVHELGHFLGLDHSPVRESTMLYSLAEDLQTPKAEDVQGLLSLYPPASGFSDYGTLKGSFTDSSSSPIFGAMIFVLDPRTLHVVASEVTDVNGAFEFCALPSSSYLVMANRYKPYGANIHSYYSGDAKGSGSFTENLQTFCFNPSCEVMNEEASLSLLSHAATGAGSQGGLALSLIEIVGSQSSQFLNLTAESDELDFDLVGGTLLQPGSSIQLDEARFAKLGSTPVSLNGSTVLASDFYSFVAPQSGSVIVKTASLRINTRVQISIQLFDSSGNSVSCSANPVSTSTIALAEDAGLECSSLNAGQSYHLQVSGSGVSCRDIPGNYYGDNTESCEDASIGEDASTAQPYYVVTVFDSNQVNEYPEGNLSLYESFSKASQAWTGMPTCSSFTGTVSKGSSGGSCCGSLGDRGPGSPSGPKSFLLGLLLSPLFWFSIGWILKVGRSNKSYKIA